MWNVWVDLKSNKRNQRGSGRVLGDLLILKLHNTVLDTNLSRLSMLVFWVVMPCGLVGRYKRFGAIQPWRLRLYFPQRIYYLPTSPHDVTTQKTIFDTSRPQISYIQIKHSFRIFVEVMLTEVVGETSKSYKFINTLFSDPFLCIISLTTDSVPIKYYAMIMFAQNFIFSPPGLFFITVKGVFSTYDAAHPRKPNLRIEI
jgi:hypothetical protein